MLHNPLQITITVSCDHDIPITKKRSIDETAVLQQALFSLELDLFAC